MIDQWASDPASLYLAARWTSAVLGSLACVLTAVAGARLFGRLAGCIAGALLATAFVPVYYGHFALNDSALLLPMAVALVGVAGILRGGSRWDYLLAGVGSGLAAGTKYTAGVVIVAAMIAVAARWREAWPARIGLLAVGALAAFVISNPYSVLDASQFLDGLSEQEDIVSNPSGKVGQVGDGGIPYCLGALALGLGWLPLLAAAAGSVLLAIRERATALVLLVSPAVYLVFMSGVERWFARWAIPMMPFACLLAGYAAAVLVHRLPATPALARRLAVPVLIALLAGQGVFLSARSNTVLGSTDTRQQLRDWMVANVPRGSRMIVEAFALPDAWLRNPTWAEPPAAGPPGPIWATVRELAPSLAPDRLEYFRRSGWCLFLSSSNERDRVEVDPAASDEAVAFYRQLDRTSSRLFSASPWRPGVEPTFDFDRSFLYYGGDRRHPGPFVELRRLDRCPATPARP